MEDVNARKSFSVKKSIKAKLGRVQQSINEILTKVENCHNNSIGGICSGIQIREASVIPFLYHGSDSWVEVSVNEVKTLNKITGEFMRKLLRTTKTCSIIPMYWQLGFWLPEKIIIENKLRLIHPLSHLDQN